MTKGLRLESRSKQVIPDAPEIVHLFVRGRAKADVSKWTIDAVSAKKWQLYSKLRHWSKLNALPGTSDVIEKLILKDKPELNRYKAAVWKTLSKYANTSPNGMDGLEALYVITSCYCQAKASLKLTKEDQEKHLQKISRHVERLKKSLKAIGGETWSVKRVLEEDPQAREAIERHDRFVITHRLWQSMPKVPELLSSIVPIARKELADSPRVNRKTKEVHLFVRLLNREFREELNRPLDEVVAACARLLFDYQMTAENVRELTSAPR